ncbi:MAG: extracellular solute-binding protein [Acidocella sp.]|nr:extracellular solute-binding protein [Acidocella sp.]
MFRRATLLVCLLTPGYGHACVDLITLGDAAQPPPGFSHLPYANPNAPKGGSMVLGAIGSFNDLNPFILRGTAPDSTLQIWQPLFKLSDTDSVTEYAELAQCVRVHGSAVTFTLNPKARFSDGTPVTGADVIWTYHTLITQGAPFYAAEYAQIASATAPDAHTARFILKPSAGPDTVFNLAGMYILPAHFWAHRDFAAPLKDIPIGSGAYRVVRADWGRRITYQLIPNFWARDIPADKGFNNFAHLTEIFVRDKAALNQAFRAGQIDAMVETSAQDWAHDYDFPAVRNGAVTRAVVPETLPAGMSGLVMNTRMPILADPRVRRALTLAFDFQWENRTLLGGDAIREVSYFSNTPMAATGLPMAGELALLAPFRATVPSAVFTRPFTLPVTDGSGYNLPELSAAMRLLTQAGWHIHNLVLVNRQGMPMRLEILLDDTADERLVLPYAHNLGLLGIKVTVRLLDATSYQARLADFNFDMTPADFPVSAYPGSEQAAYWGCAAASQPGSANLAGVCTPATDAMINAEITAADPAAKREAIHALDRLLLNGYYVIPWFYHNTQRLAWWQTRVAQPGIPLQTGHDFSLWWAR